MKNVTIALTRSQKAALKAVKIKVAAYKAAKGSTAEEFDYTLEEISPVNSIVNSLTTAHPILLEKEWADVLKSMEIAVKNQDYSFEDIDKATLVAEYAHRHLGLHGYNIGDVFEYEDLPALQRFVDQYGKTALEAAWHDTGRDEKFTEVELDFYGQMAAYLKANNICIDWLTFSNWREHGFNLNLLQLEMNTSSDVSIFTAHGSEVQEYNRYYDDNRQLISSESVLDYLKGWWFMEEDYLEWKWTNFCRLHLEKYVDRHQFISWILQGKNRMIKKHSTYLQDRLEANGLSSLTSTIQKREVQDAWRLVELVESGFKLNPKLLKNSVAVEARGFNKFEVAIAAIFFGASYSEASDYMISHTAICNHVVPEKMMKGLAANPNIFAWVYDNNLDIDWTSGNSARLCVINSISRYYTVDLKTAEKLFENPSQIEAIEYSKTHPQIATDILPKANLEYQGWTLTKVPKNDLLNLTMGDTTSCCQKLGGLGESVCTEGWNDTHSVNYVFTSPSGKVAAHFWAWLDANGGLVIDSVEGLSSTSADVIAELLIDFIDANPEISMYISKTSYGLTKDVVARLKEEFILKEMDEPTHVTEYSYTDSSNGVYHIL